MIETAVKVFGHLDILVNNAGGAKPSTIWDVTEKEFDNCINLNLKSVFNCTKHACGIMKEQRWGRIISATSGARMGMPGNSSYGTAKAGIVGFTACMALELGGFNITCNCYSPLADGPMATPESRKAAVGFMLESGLIGREQYEFLAHHVAGPETIAPLVVYLSTDEASDITGQVFHISGNQTGIHWEPFLKDGMVTKDGKAWTVEGLIKEVPRRLLKGYVSPLKTPGRCFVNAETQRSTKKETER
jgi:3-oxoacyl-[acyl-carrier protein] reductase